MKLLHFQRIATALLLGLFTVSCTKATAEPVITPADVYFLPIGDVSTAMLDELASYYKQKFKLSVTVLPSLPIEDRTIDNNRR